MGVYRQLSQEDRKRYIELKEEITKEAQPEKHDMYTYFRWLQKRADPEAYKKWPSKKDRRGNPGGAKLGRKKGWFFFRWQKIGNTSTLMITEPTYNGEGYRKYKTKGAKADKYIRENLIGKVFRKADLKGLGYINSAYLLAYFSLYNPKYVVRRTGSISDPVFTIEERGS